MLAPRTPRTVIRKAASRGWCCLLLAIVFPADEAEIIGEQQRGKRADAQAQLRRKSLRRNECFDKPGADEHETYADEQDYGTPGVSYERIDASQSAWIEERGR